MGLLTFEQWESRLNLDHFSSYEKWAHYQLYLKSKLTELGIKKYN